RLSRDDAGERRPDEAGQDEAKGTNARASALTPSFALVALRPVCFGRGDRTVDLSLTAREDRESGVVPPSRSSLREPSCPATHVRHRCSGCVLRFGRAIPAQGCPERPFPDVSWQAEAGRAGGRAANRTTPEASG